MTAVHWDPDGELRAAWHRQVVPTWDPTTLWLRAAYRAAIPRRRLSRRPRLRRTTVLSALAASALVAGLASIAPGLPRDREIGGTRVPASAQLIRADAARTEILHGRVRLILLHDQHEPASSPTKDQ